MIIQILTILLCSALFAYGGDKDHNFKRFYMPIVLTLACWYVTKSWWAFTVLAGIPFQVEGYGDKAILTKVFNTGWSRSVWGILAALGLSLGLFLTGHMAWYWFALYLAVGFVLYNAIKNLWQVAGDLIVGATFGCLVLLIH